MDKVRWDNSQDQSPWVEPLPVVLLFGKSYNENYIIY